MTGGGKCYRLFCVYQLNLRKSVKLLKFYYKIHVVFTAKSQLDHSPSFIPILKRGQHFP